MGCTQLSTGEGSVLAPGLGTVSEARGILEFL